MAVGIYDNSLYAYFLEISGLYHNSAFQKADNYSRANIVLSTVLLLLTFLQPDILWCVFWKRFLVKQLLASLCFNSFYFQQFAYTKFD